MRIRAVVLAVAFAGAVLEPAAAADQSVNATKAPSYYPNTYYPPATMWTGFYVGTQIGGDFGRGSWTSPFTGLGDRPTGSGILGGVQAGANWQWDWFVSGLETDFTFTDLTASASDTAGNTHTIETTWLSTTAARFGYAAGAWLFYAKAGVAVGDERNTVTAPTGVAAVGAKSVQVGWVAGGGVEYALTHNWSARLEYDFIDFDHVNSVPSAGRALPFAPGFTGSQTVDWTIQKVVGAVNYRF